MRCAVQRAVHVDQARAGTTSIGPVVEPMQHPHLARASEIAAWVLRWKPEIGPSDAPRSVALHYGGELTGIIKCA
jgi:hypothetical protein